MDKSLVAHTSITINAPAEKVWNALIDPNLIKQYMFGAKVACQWKEGRPITWKGERQGKRFEGKGTILKIHPGHILQYSHYSPVTGKPDAPEHYHIITIELSSDGSLDLRNGREQTTVLLYQDNNETEEMREHSEKNWYIILEGLKKVTET